MADKNILLIEPNYRNKYPPLGLMKIAQYHGLNGKRDHVTFIKGQDERVLAQKWDRIYVTTLFSFEYPTISECISFALKAANGCPEKVFVGGIAASLLHERFITERRWQGVRFIKGLLSEPPAVALELDQSIGELYSDDLTGIPIDELVPDYSILDQIDYRYPVRDAYFAYTSRGCIRKCHFCGVPQLEGMQRDVGSLSAVVRAIDKAHGPKKDLILMDNNVVASPRFKEIIAEIRDLGFVRGAALTRSAEQGPVPRRVDFNQGVDARILCKNPMYLKELASICIKPLRIAFDHLGVRKPYEKAVRYAHEYGLNEFSNYMLYNLHDGPDDLFARMRINVALTEELGIRVWSFPMRFQPTARPDQGHVGEKWSRYQLRSMQIILQATGGIVSGDPALFRTMFGDTTEEYERILLLPHDYIFNRQWYEHSEGQGELADYQAAMAKLDSHDRAELLAILSSTDLRHFSLLKDHATTAAVRSVLPFYAPKSTDELTSIRDQIKTMTRGAITAEQTIPEDEWVEDAGLDYAYDMAWK
jgi:hypothetical protein